MKECCKTYLDEQFGGDAEIVNEIYGEYVSSVHIKLAEAEMELEGAAWQQLDRTAHTIKGNALAAGDGEMAETAIRLRQITQLQDSAQAGELIGRLKELAEQL